MPGFESRDPGQAPRSLPLCLFESYSSARCAAAGRPAGGRARGFEEETLLGSLGQAGPAHAAPRGPEMLPQGGSEAAPGKPRPSSARARRAPAPRAGRPRSPGVPRPPAPLSLPSLAPSPRSERAALARLSSASREPPPPPPPPPPPGRQQSRFAGGGCCPRSAMTAPLLTRQRKCRDPINGTRKRDTHTPWRRHAAI